MEHPCINFRDIGITTWLTKQLEELNLRHPTPVQTNCIPKILEGSDVLGCAKTGTGKTLAFVLPILQQLSSDPFGIFALILTPTRELAFQIGDQFNALGRQLNLKCSIIVGGRHQMAQAQELVRRPHIVIATPGRLADHLQSDQLGIARLLSTIRFLVLDEADRLLDPAYALQLSIRKPYFFEEKDQIQTVKGLEQRFVLCPRTFIDAYLVYIVKEFYTSRESSSILVFVKTCRECQTLALMFKKLGFEVGSLHSEVLQSLRMSSLARFRSGRIRIMICTDVAARGLDIPHVDLVVNHNVPRCPKSYLHRVGRSARAGRFGAAVTFVTQHDVLLLRSIEQVIGEKMEQIEVPHHEVTLYAAKVLATKREAEIRLENQDNNSDERKENWRRKELILQGMNDKLIEKEISRWKDNRKSKPILIRRKKQKKKLNK
ncbi:unnamed protein product [Meloidogyne enterolobii]|uniref:Uncharacterized protein n=1 Tax=Meloidogyne enterolobii TaxID=390850 RepID=A0ACB1ALS2_MELEN